MSRESLSSADSSQGHFGAVYLARAKRADDFLLALKCLQKKDIERNGSETQVRREIEVCPPHRTLNHV